MEIDNKALYVFFDTNLCLHFTPLDKIANLLEVLKIQRAYLILTGIVMSELSGFKDDSRNAKRQKRAKNAITMFKRYLSDIEAAQPVHVREGIWLIDLPRGPRIDWDTLELDPKDKDDRLIASMIYFREQYPSAQICLLSDDFTAQRKAVEWHFRVIEPDGKIDRLGDKTPEEEEIQRLKQENLELRTRIPKFEFGFWEQKTICQKVECLWQVYSIIGKSDQDIEKEIEQTRQKIKGMKAELHSSASTYASSVIGNIFANYQHFLKQLEDALRAQQQWGERVYCKLYFALHNKGTIPATSIDIRISFPSGTQILDLSKHREPIQIPREPDIHNPSDLIYLSHLRAHPPIPLPDGPRGPLYQEGFPNVVYYQTTKVRQHEIWSMQSVQVYLPKEMTEKRSGGFQVEYILRADELPKPEEGTITVIWKHETLPKNLF